MNSGSVKKLLTNKTCLYSQKTHLFSIHSYLCKLGQMLLLYFPELLLSVNSDVVFCPWMPIIKQGLGKNNE